MVAGQLKWMEKPYRKLYTISRETKLAFAFIARLFMLIRFSHKKRNEMNDGDNVLRGNGAPKEIAQVPSPNEKWKYRKLG